MKSLKYLFFLPILILLLGCPSVDDGNSSIYIKNNSENDILFVQTGDRYTECTEDSIPNKNTGRVIEANKTVYDNLVLTHCTTYLYLLSMDTVNKYSWDDIRKNYRYMKKYIINNKSDLKKIDYTITYP
ncbi:hypothetical protein M2451_004171 [Dysgonomonas sp. PFB1-18]|uniref:hypothetical protein n=1 Tax=unclassified Dysgonomonas TaxID=2630389 RepID=UPI002474C041|nr:MULTISPECIES: hypothetical protein [unclassified Dysgonomonas]MDH6307233.1 hypothetical protein [Dysgonomonas sp. PF1-14]MDH6337151.1 hypothetical protein [Dysgonomonas sp. PF1-16]MDH6382818.1 hypothetical protein [Dysgonomonas sp. PFB1-18]MDH6400100.1 hypothetical protein [Dysgonomonas sp. PF1-23]